MVEGGTGEDERVEAAGAGEFAENGVDELWREGKEEIAVVWVRGRLYKSCRLVLSIG